MNIIQICVPLNEDYKIFLEIKIKYSKNKILFF